MKIYYDLHIHTALSPCGDIDMTPNNIVNMSIIKGLDVIAITDHNSCKNVKAVMDIAEPKNIIVIPGIEVETSEAIHLVCLFQNIKDVERFAIVIDDNLPYIKNRVDIFGEQHIFNANDEIIGYEDKLLLNSTKLPINNIIEFVKHYKGIVFPAHIDRDSYSILSNLGYISEDLAFKLIEISYNTDEDTFFSGANGYLRNYKTIRSSDAHYLEDIAEAFNYFDIKEKNIENIFSYLNGF